MRARPRLRDTRRGPPSDPSGGSTGTTPPGSTPASTASHPSSGNSSTVSVITTVRPAGRWRSPRIWEASLLRRCDAREAKEVGSEFREGAVRLVLETGRPIVEIAREIDVNPGTLGNWVDKARQADRP